MAYLPDMDVIDSDMMEQVLRQMNDYDYEQYTSASVQAALRKDSLSVEDFAAMLSPAAEAHLEEMARRARAETARFFGNSITMFTPLYIANYCENHCVYCGFNCFNKIKRGKLTMEEIETELRTIAATGLQEVLILTGECRGASGPEYIGHAVRLANQYFSTVGIEIYPLNVEEYRYIQSCGADFVSVYQETYDTDRYDEMHPMGTKRIYPYRFYAQERAILGGMRGVAFGALLGLGNFRKDAYAAGLHASLLQKKYPHAEIAFSFPRLRPYINNAKNNPNDVGERQLLQTMLAYRLFMPFAGITISTRERAGFRDNVIGLAATKISAGVSVGVGGHGEEAKGDEQFDISDPRSVDDVRSAIARRGMQPVFTDYVRV
jgi:2-iminoacetate synthase